MLYLTKDELKMVIASSAGNHAQGVALSNYQQKCKAKIVMPITTPLVQVNLVRSLNAEVTYHGDTYDETYQEAVRLGKNMD